MCLDADLALWHGQNRARRCWLGRGDNVLTILPRSSGPLPESGSTLHAGRAWNDPRRHGDFDPVDCLSINSAMNPSAPLPHHRTSQGQPNPLDPHPKPPTRIDSTDIGIQAVPTRSHLLSTQPPGRRSNQSGPRAEKLCHGPEQRQRAFFWAKLDLDLQYEGVIGYRYE